MPLGFDVPELPKAKEQAVKAAGKRGVLVLLRSGPSSARVVLV